MKRGCLDNLLFAAVLLVAFGASTYFWFNFFVRGKSIPTPNLIGQRIADAKAICSDLGLILAVDPNQDRHSDRVAAGRVVWQNRTAGPANYVKRGTRIFVGASKGPLVLTVPDLAGQSQRTALLRLGLQSLKLGSVTYIDSAGAQNIIAEDPPVGTVVPAQTPVSLLLGLPPAPRPYVMPDLIDRPLDEVRPAMEAQGLVFSNVRFETYPGIRDGIIIRQFPLRGSPVTGKDPISLVVTRQEEGRIIEQPPGAPAAPATPQPRTP
jgi:beta-lactam-binding protein with PASTA domain